MLFAIDIDGTVATPVGTDGYACYVNQRLGIEISPEWKMEYGSSFVDQLLSDSAVQAWIEHDGSLKPFTDVVFEGQYSAIVQERSLPITGAVEALSGLAENHRLIYITNRKNATREVTRNWLLTHGFPYADKLYCCGDEQGFVSKVRYAVSERQKDEQLIFIDDMARYYEPTFVRLLQDGRDYVLAFIHHIAVMRFGSTVLPHCPYKYPIFPMAGLPTWAELGETIATLAPYIGAETATYLQFLDATFVPALLRRTRDPRIFSATPSNVQGASNVHYANPQA